MTKLAVKPNRTTFICLILLALFFVPLSLGNFWQLRHGFRFGPILWGLLPVLLLAPIIWLTRRGHSRSVKVFTEDGLTRNDGHRFFWFDLESVIEQLHRFRNTPDVLWRVEIHFKNGGCAWLIPNKISNRAEVLAYVGALPCEHKTVRV
jgi:hypothetical protein